MPSAGDIAAYKKAAANYEAGEYKPGDFVSPGGASTGGAGRKKLTKEKMNTSGDRFSACDDWLSPGSGAKRSWQPKNPAYKNLSLYDMK